MTALEDLRAKAPFICELLEGWSVRPHQEYDRFVWLNGPDGMGIALSPDRPTDNRVEISGLTGDLHEFWANSRKPLGKITVAASRSGLDIAHEIKRRLLPVYEKSWKELRAKATQTYEARRDLAGHVAWIVKEFPQIDFAPDQSRDNLRIWGLHLGGTLSAYGYHELKIQAADFEAVTRILKALYPKEEIVR